MKLALVALAAFAFLVVAWCVVVMFAPFHPSSLPASYP